MPILETEEYNEMWETSQQYQDVLKTLQEKDVEAEQIVDLLEDEQEKVEEAVVQLRNNGLIEQRTGHGDPYFSITSLGESALEYDDKEEYLQEMNEREDEFEEVYGGDE